MKRKLNKLFSDLEYIPISLLFATQIADKIKGNTFKTRKYNNCNILIDFTHKRITSLY
jgi:hypothetical protein